MSTTEDTETPVAPADLLPTGSLVDPETAATDEADAEEAVEPTAADLLPIGNLADEEPAEATEETQETEVEVLDEDALLALDEGEPGPKPESAYDRPGNWYVVHTQSGYENKVRKNLDARTASMNLEDRILEIVIPMEDVVEFRNGKKVTVAKKMFPGYLLVRCYLDDTSWAAIRDTPGIVNFVGAGGKPSRLSRREIETFLPTVDESSTEAPVKAKARLGFDTGDTVRVKEGPFADFSGEIIEINVDQLKVKVLVNIFGRETPVELEFSQVAQL
ncbi:MAG: transcription termination/antitermination factor NusG [Acidimicrobiia bacterium]|nr:transcription termination/antitermination factor NusG [Actinomycetota bacterium]MBL6924558.1 transcription termination/antitermination factor NusG [Acidimicrobiia bacterium]MBL6926149.1 transcription termination/antitermination factor NusG [Acidimicrobiia bacterium]